MREYDLVIVGGGLAGCAAAITLMRSVPQARVLVLERGFYPRHKVCGEFVSPEGCAALDKLLEADEVSLLVNQAPPIVQANIHVDGRTLSAPVRPPAASITRFDLDSALWKQAEKLGAECCEKCPVLKVQGDGPFEITIERANIHSAALINAAGRWSIFNRTKTRDRNGCHNIKWIGLKAHFAEATSSRSGVIDLYLFNGGYCGVQPVGLERVNACAMVRAEAATTLGEVFMLHPELYRDSQDWIPVMETVTTSPLYFRKPAPIEGKIINAGDAAGFIDPFVGDGMTLALHSGILAAQALTGLLKKEFNLRMAIEIYSHEYNARLLPAFQRARWLRKMISLPGVVRMPLARLIQMTGTTESLLKATRIAV